MKKKTVRVAVLALISLMLVFVQGFFMQKNKEFLIEGNFSNIYECCIDEALDCGAICKVKVKASPPKEKGRQKT
jgi:hypothetical protein